ncbi:DUF4231 domain-containing protein [Mycoplasma sp. ATU-Cv-703]|uniref:DUF4231 domain-containing protein n=1 Tax=Mycoplasma sp. ATU-Cv-703 TaxID=2498595 RepID=UPI000FDE4446
MRETFNIEDYGHKIVDFLKHRVIGLERAYVSINVIILLLGLATSIFSIIFASKLFGLTTVPDWYPYITAGIGAFTTLVTSLFNFFHIRESLKRDQNALNRVWVEINKYESQLVPKYRLKDREYNLFVAVEAILGNETAKTEVLNSEQR